MVRRRRRAKGLLREEVADLAGVSLTWYTWIEQARPTNPSRRVLDGLARALQLDAVERAHLFRLARPDLKPQAARVKLGRLSAPLLEVLHGLAPHPAYAIDGLWNLLAWNEPAGVVFGFDDMKPGERNVLRAMLLYRPWRTLFANWETIVESVVAQFRAATPHLSDDPVYQAFVEQTRAASPLFDSLWDRGRVAGAQANQKILHHPQLGSLRFNYATLRPDGAAPDVRFSIYVGTPPDAQDTGQPG